MTKTDNNEILTLEKLVDEEIERYKEIEKLYTDKKEILISGKSSDLLNIDSQILNTFRNINNIALKRISSLEKLEIQNPSMSAIIDFVKDKDISIAKRFEEKKNHLGNISENIKKLEKVNLDLTKHGINFTNKTLEIILKGAAVSTTEYNQRGQNISGENLEMSSIIEEA